MLELGEIEPQTGEGGGERESNLLSWPEFENGLSMKKEIV